MRHNQDHEHDVHKHEDNTEQDEGEHNETVHENNHEHEHQNEHDHNDDQEHNEPEHEHNGKEGEIYILLHENNIYIGSSVDTRQRWHNHKRNAKNKTSKLYNFIRSVGFNKIKFIIIDKIIFSDIRELKQLEQYYKDEYIKSNKFNVLNSNECFLNLGTNDPKQYQQLYQKTKKRREYQRIYKQSDKHKHYIKNYRIKKKLLKQTMTESAEIC